MSEDTTNQEARRQTPPQPPPQIGWAARWLDQGETVAQALVGLLLFLAALLTIGYAIYDFIYQFTVSAATLPGQGQTTHLSNPQRLADAIITLISDVLLVLIILEVLSTVLHYLRERTVSLKPFLFIGMISAVREILAVSAQLAVFEVKGEEFWKLMIELGVSTGIILGLGITLRLLTRETATDQL
jgi:uncharacterized membrane protein (DUF373 family)